VLRKGAAGDIGEAHVPDMSIRSGFEDLRIRKDNFSVFKDFV
jgi:hypothetical protein